MHFTSQQFSLLFRRILLIASLLCKINHVTYAQTVVGMGTKTPNPHAVLELVATEGNQGLLVPRLSTAEMNSLAGRLSSQDNGLLIFGQAQGSFYYWWDSQWQTLRPAAQVIGADTDSINDLQTPALPTSQILVGNASGIATPVNISGDIALNSDGTMTITLDAITTAKLMDQAVTTAKLADDAVTKEKLAADVAGNGLSQAGDGSLQTANTGSGSILIGQGNTVAAQVLSGDVALSADGSTTVEGLQGRTISSTAPNTNDVLRWDGSTWVPDDGRASSEVRWFSGTIDPAFSSFNGGQVGDLFYKHDEDRYWRRTGSNAGDWSEIAGLSGGSDENGKRMNGQLNVGSQPAIADREVGMLWLDSSGSGRIRMWTGSSWQTLISGD